ncbi:MAG: hypothetical protein V5A20_04500 [Salinibacter sp.]|uniref:CIS tube protein n=1 Tax=Salinibacter sp. TaxID=2065818 RepID=UPI002FC2A42C
MPDEQHPGSRAQLKELNAEGDVKEKGLRVEAQFNPKTLEVRYRNQISGTDQKENTGSQYGGKGKTSMSVTLFFDVTRPTNQASASKDVRERTKEVYEFMQVKGGGGGNRRGSSDGEDVPPNVRFVWGSFFFDGVVDSMSESLEFFDPKGRPLRATVSISLSKQEVRFEPEDIKGKKPSGPGVQGNIEAGEKGPEERPDGAENTNATSVQQAAAKQGEQRNWKEIAAESGVENPRAIHNPDALES